MRLIREGPGRAIVFARWTRPAEERRAARRRAHIERTPPMTHLHRPLAAAALALSLSGAAGLSACDVRSADASRVSEDARPGPDPDTRFEYGPSIQVGAGRARTYVLLDTKAGDRPIE